MNAKDMIAAGRLMDARKQLTDEVKKAPSDSAKRTLLFQVLAFLGEWEKADRHLDLIVATNPKSEIGVQAYKNAVNAEKERREVMERKRVPGFVTGAPAYLESYLLAWDKLKENDLEGASRLYEQVEEQRRPVRGSLDGKIFDGFWDTDTFLSCFLEAIVHDRYIWIPLETIGELSIDPPKSLFDLLWAPARVMTWEGVNLQCYLPVLYPDSCLQDDERVKLGRLTDWIPLGGPFFKGVGQHVFQVGEEEIPLLEMREFTFSLGKGEKER
jgi:type VI secretion system protein ImpE